jgi:hypothetical protein
MDLAPGTVKKKFTGRSFDRDPLAATNKFAHITAFGMRKQTENFPQNLTRVNNELLHYILTTQCRSK